ncbi:MAG: hypothetical protein UR67_C0001G0039 [candidate division CPR3 bacterium GW2011_GWF2_35_18]|uniref:Uncharacterized protein n=1 Tax=candidate division CPR3 bacterium GW2011_GWF2_35_18 TaxID=1618350 RepID=A0A0G0E470_UNCC3|nr:MAG: hypothetical protein UR67_C0001G0039 [candidate division CPR3 bacterium GW2011_GWF2_35_18]
MHPTRIEELVHKIHWLAEVTREFYWIAWTFYRIRVKGLQGAVILQEDKRDYEEVIPSDGDFRIPVLYLGLVQKGGHINLRRQMHNGDYGCRFH